MREKDAATKAYMELNDVFADVMNYYIYDGEEVLRPEDLKPVFTIVVYYGTQRWDGPKSLHEMMEPLPPGIEELVQDYRIHLIEPSTMTEEDFDKFHTDLGEVMRFLQAADDKEKLSALFHSRPIYRKIRLEAALVLNTCGKLRMKMEPDEEGDVDMCKGWEGMLQDAVEEGIEKRVQEVVEERVQEVVEERVQEVVKERVQEAVEGAREDERKKSAICSVRELIRNTGWTMEQAMNAIAVAEEYRGAVREALG